MGTPSGGSNGSYPASGPIDNLYRFGSGTASGSAMPDGVARDRVTSFEYGTTQHQQQQTHHSHRSISIGSINGLAPAAQEQNQTVLVVQPDGLIEANITERDPSGHIQTRRESRDYFEGVVGLSKEGKALFAPT